MRGRWISILAGLLVVSVLAAACVPLATTNEPTKNKDNYTDITVEQLAEMLENKDFVMINVHIPYDGEIERTDLFIPFDEIADRTDELPQKDAKIVLYCRSGSMSTTAAPQLAALGYTNLFEVDGGMKAWTVAGNELIRK